MNHSSKRLRVGIQGVRASFHDEAARKYFKQTELELVECASFRSLCEALASGETDFNIMAIENSIAGSILPNYLLLEQFKARVIGEVYLRIAMNIMAMPGQKITDLQSVQSHPMAIYQCEDFLAKYPQLKVLEANDTADSARVIAEKKWMGHAAIAPRLASEVYGLEILEAGIETNKQNYTRFLVVSRGEYWHSDEKPNKASLRFETSHRPGGLLEVLKIFADHKMNMTKLQSVPILGRPYQYAFHADLEWEKIEDYHEVLKELKLNDAHLLEFGTYQKQERPG